MVGGRAKKSRYYQALRGRQLGDSRCLEEGEPPLVTNSAVDSYGGITQPGLLDSRQVTVLVDLPLLGIVDACVCVDDCSLPPQISWDSGCSPPGLEA